DLAPGARAEAQLLDLVRDRISPAVPQWRVHAEDLIAYPLLPGRPGLTIDDGEVTWHVDVASQPFAQAYGHLAGQLHQVPREEVAAAGLPTPSIAEVRDARAADLARVAEAFTIAPALRERWEKWLGDDSGWPAHTVFTHGELY